MPARMLKASLFVNYFLFAILLNSVGAVILQVQNAYGVSESAASVLEAYKDLSIALASFLVGSYVARLGYQRAMLLALGLITCVCLAMPQLPAFWMTKLLFVMTGVSFAVVKICVYASLSLIARDVNEHASTMNFLEAFFMVGVLSGYFLFSAFVNDLNPSDPRWLHVYYLLAALSLFALSLLSSVQSTGHTAAPGEAREASGYAAMLRLFALPLVYLFLLCAFLYVLIEQSIMTWLPTFNSRVLNLSPSLAIQMTSMLAAATALGRFAAGFLLRFLHWHALLTGCLLAAAMLVLLVLPLADGDSAGIPVTNWLDAPAAAWLFPLIGALLAPVYPAINSVILSSLEPRQHAPMAGLIVLFSALGGTTGSLVTGTLFEIMDGRSAFYFSLVPLGALLVGLWFFRRRSDV